MTDLDALQRCLRGFFQTHGSDYGLRRGRVRIEHVLNLGNFVNASFCVADGVRRLHVKVVPAREGGRELRRWVRHAEHLATRHHAPPVLGVFEIMRGTYVGAVFPRLQGRQPNLRAEPELIPLVVGAAAALHADADLAAALEAEMGPVSCLRALERGWLRVMRSDLRETMASEDAPPFVGPEGWRWMRDEVEAVAAAAAAHPAFALPAPGPVHGDLSEANVLVDGERWYLLDWDDLRLGDPAEDWVHLLWDLLRDDPSALAHLLPADPAARERVALHCRVALLLDVIDPLADWTEAWAVPGSTADVRPVKRALYERSLALYRTRYGRA